MGLNLIALRFSQNEELKLLKNLLYKTCPHQSESDIEVAWFVTCIFLYIFFLLFSWLITHSQEKLCLIPK